MKYLVTGATGLIGNNVVRQLLDANVEVRALARGGAECPQLSDLDIEVVQGDVRDAEAVSRAVQGVAVVIHAAAHVQVGWTHPELHQQVNVEGTRLIAEAALKADARLIHISTVNTLGIGLLSNPADEESGLPGLVNCPYVASKLRGEQAVQELVARGLEATIVHPGFCLGPWDWKPSSGRMLLAVNRGAFVAPSGAFNVVDVRDVSAGIAEAAKFAGQSRRYILGGQNLSYLDAWRMFARVGGHYGPRFRMGPIARWLGSWGSDAWARLTGEEGGVNSATIGIGSQHSCFSSRRAERELGYRVRPLEQTVADAWNWFRERGYVSRQRSPAQPIAASTQAVAASTQPVAASTQSVAASTQAAAQRFHS